VAVLAKGAVMDRPWGQTLGALALPELDVRVAGLRRRDGSATPPDDAATLGDGDTLVLSGRPEALAVAIERLQKG